jgi:15-cis-phytoene synthase
MTSTTDPHGTETGLSANGGIARRFDPDRFFCALFLPRAVRDDAFTVIAFNHESVRALAGLHSRSVAGPLAGLIRLQWWREIVEGAPHPHEVAGPLRALIGAGRVRRDTLLGILDAREAELEGLADWAAWRAAMRGGAGGVQVAIAQIADTRGADTRGAGQDDPEPMRPDQMRAVEALGAAYGVGGLLRHLDAVLAGGRCPLPESALHEFGLSGDAIRDGAGLQGADPAALAALRARLREEGLAFLAQAGAGAGVEAGRVRLPRAVGAAALPGVLARRDLRRGDGGGADRGLGDRLAVMAAMALGRF